MQILTIHNTTDTPYVIDQSIVVPANGSKDVSMPQAAFDGHYREYISCAAQGVLFADPAGTYDAAQAIARPTAAGALASTVRNVLVNNTGASFLITLMAASDLDAGEVVRFKRLAGTVTIGRAGADTIDGGSSALTLDDDPAYIVLTSDGVSAWTSA